MKYSWKGHKDKNRHKNRIERSGQARLVYVKDINREVELAWTHIRAKRSSLEVHINDSGDHWHSAHRADRLARFAPYKNS